MQQNFKRQKPLSISFFGKSSYSFAQDEPTCSFHNPTRIPPCWNMRITQSDQILGMELGGLWDRRSREHGFLDYGSGAVLGSNYFRYGTRQRQQLLYMNSEMWQNVYSEIKMHSIAFFFLDMELTDFFWWCCIINRAQVVKRKGVGERGVLAGVVSWSWASWV